MTHAPTTAGYRQRIRHIVIIFVAMLLISACNSPPSRSQDSEIILGTVISVTLYADNPQEIFEEIFARVREIEEKMSTSEEDYASTELLRVNRAAGRAAVAVSPDTYEVVTSALQYSELTRGRFDLTVGPLVDLWGIGTESAGVPDPDELAEAVDLIDYEEVELFDGRSEIFLPRPEMAIDVGGIAKGYAADEAARILRERGVDSALLDFGGNIMTIGTKPDDVPWRIGLQIPEIEVPRGQFLGIAEVTDLSVVTSGTYERYFIYQGTRYHHILDTETGQPVRNSLASVTIITEESMRADALSTAVFAMGLEEGMRFTEDLEDVEAIFVTEDRKVYLTSGAGETFRLTSPNHEIAEL
jgi:thiamine biosynthesis lipoprotein